MTELRYFTVGRYDAARFWPQEAGIDPRQVRHVARGHELQGAWSGAVIVLMNNWWDAYSGRTAVEIAQQIRMLRAYGAEVRIA